MQHYLVTNIQRFSLHDGPGIRTTVFLKGCSVRCPWCANPENLSGEIQPYVKDGKHGFYGEWISEEALYQKLIRDYDFYCIRPMDYCVATWEEFRKLPGGVTFSGGEPLLQAIKMQSLWQRLHDRQIHIAAETGLFVSTDCMQAALQYVDLFYVDIKIADQEGCMACLKGSYSQYLHNLQLLQQSGKPFVFRIPVIGGYTDTDENRKNICSLIGAARGNLIKIELLKEHSLGLSKYQALADGGTPLTLPDYQGVSDELLEDYRQEITSFCDVPVEICRV